MKPCPTHPSAPPQLLAGRSRRPRHKCAACGGTLTANPPPNGWKGRPIFELAVELPLDPYMTNFDFYPAAHHLHCTGAFIGLVHNWCNLRLWQLGDHLTRDARETLRHYPVNPWWRAS